MIESGPDWRWLGAEELKVNSVHNESNYLKVRV